MGVGYWAQQGTLRENPGWSNHKNIPIFLISSSYDEEGLYNKTKSSEVNTYIKKSYLMFTLVASPKASRGLWGK